MAIKNSDSDSKTHTPPLFISPDKRRFTTLHLPACVFILYIYVYIHFFFLAKARVHSRIRLFRQFSFFLLTGMNKLVGAGDVRRAETGKGESGGGRRGRTTAEEKRRTPPIYNPPCPAPTSTPPLLPSTFGEAMEGEEGKEAMKTARMERYK